MQLPRGWKPLDVIVSVITFSVCFVMIVVIVGRVITGSELSKHIARSVTETVIALITIISIYVGSKLQRSWRNGKDED